MLWQLGKLFLAAGMITFSSWLAGKQPKLAGFVLALPVSSMIALLLFQAEYHDAAKAAEFARAILAAIPLSLFFFVPFLFAEKFPFGFAGMFLAGIALLGVAYWLHTRLA